MPALLMVWFSILGERLDHLLTHGNERQDSTRTALNWAERPQT
jgi:hypothetical protein